MNRCDETRSFLSEQLDAPDLAPSAAVDEHLKNCNECSLYERELAQVARRLSAAPAGDSSWALEPPADLHSAIMAEVRSTTVEPSKVTAFPRWLIPTSIGAAAAILILAFSLSGGNKAGDTANTATPVATTAPLGTRGGLPGGFEVPVDVPGFTAAVERRMTSALSKEADALASDLGKVREFFGARLKRAVGEGS